MGEASEAMRRLLFSDTAGQEETKERLKYLAGRIITALIFGPTQKKTKEKFNGPKI